MGELERWAARREQASAMLEKARHEFYHVLGNISDAQARLHHAQRALAEAEDRIRALYAARVAPEGAASDADSGAPA